MHSFDLRVYYEDTDLAGIVYYANYLRFIERARSEWVRSLGIDQVALKAEDGAVFAVRRLEADYLMPAHFDDQLTVKTALMQATGARVVLAQDVWRRSAVVFRRGHAGVHWRAGPGDAPAVGVSGRHSLAICSRFGDNSPNCGKLLAIG